tara:strand:+ start:44287 stop:44727 length:441 start_codon:yes stop_codon:yes gene_type:complete
MASKKKTMEKLQLEVKDTLESLGCMEVVSASSRGGDARFLCRVSDEARWLRILFEYLGGEGDWYSFIGKKYFIHEGRLVFGWVLIFESSELDKAIQSVRSLFIESLDVVDEADAKTAEDEPGMIEVKLPSSAGFSKKLQARVQNLR